MFDPVIWIRSLESNRIDPTPELLIVEIGHSTMGIFGLQNDVPIGAPDRFYVLLGKDMALKVNDHDRVSFLLRSRAKPYYVAAAANSREGVVKGRVEDRLDYL